MFNLFNNKNKLKEKKTQKSSKIEIPNGWFVYEAGQSPVHLLWYVNLVNMQDLLNNIEKPRQIFKEEKNSFEEALLYAIDEIKPL